ncbi:MoxR family ATPase [Paraburkholderia fungorum]|uniref:AAA family ATPase n=1 Tax=Paraburkholderia fungorum TaxID=134537 RepID=UPI0038BBB2BD
MNAPTPSPDAAIDGERDWKIFTGGAPHDGLTTLPPPPPWRFAHALAPLAPPAADLAGSESEARRARPFIVSDPMRIAVNAALYLRRPLLLTGRPGTGKSTLIAKVAHELRLGAVLRWPINSRSTVRSGVYEYDAVGRLQAGRNEPPVEQYLKLGPLGTALVASDWPRALLIDEIDKSDLDFANDLLNVIEEGEYEIPELRRLGKGDEPIPVTDFEGNTVPIVGGRLQCRQFPFVMMTSNAEREFPAPFLRRCVRLEIEPPEPDELLRIVESHLAEHAGVLDPAEIKELVDRFDSDQRENQDVATDQLLNAVFLTVAMKNLQKRRFNKEELLAVREQLMRPLSGQGT